MNYGSQPIEAASRRFSLGNTRKWRATFEGGRARARACVPAWLVLLLATGLVSGGCASTKPAAGLDQRPEIPQNAKDAAQKEGKGPRIALTEDVLYKILVAEIAGQRGRLDLAVKNYLELAHTIPDPQLAARATRVAVFAKQNDKALEAARLWVKMAPSDLEARQVLAAMLIRAGNVDEALNHLEFVLSSEAGGAPENMRMIVNFLSREQDKAEALAVMERLVQKRQDDPDALFAYALLALRAEQAGKARQAMEKVIKRSPINSKIAMAYLSILQKEGDVQTALEWLKNVLAKEPKAFELRMVYARLLADSKRFEEARAQFEIVAKEKPDNADVKFALGLLYLQSNQLEEAGKRFTQLTNTEPYENESSFYLGQIAESRKDYETALKWYSSISKGDMLFDARLSTALVLARLNRVPEARQELRAVSAKTPEQESRLVRVEGEILTQQGDHREAMALYDRALRDRYDQELLYTRAMLAEKMGRIDLLERDLRRILEREPDNAQALNALGYSLADQTHRHQEAYALIKRALELKPNDYYILDSMGWVLYRLGRSDDAISYLRRAQAMRNDPEVAAHLGEVLWVKGQKEAARKVWESALRETPGDQKLLDVMKRLGP